MLKHVSYASKQQTTALYLNSCRHSQPITLQTDMFVALRRGDMLLTIYDKLAVSI